MNLAGLVFFTRNL